jgi:hypothetical protein
MLELDETPEKDHIWAAAEVNAEEMQIETARPDHPERTLWYCPTASIWDAHRAKALFERYDLEQVYDLGAGDCRLALWLDRQGNDVVDYELNSDIVASVCDRFSLGGLELREQDYYPGYDALTGPHIAVVAFGGTNELPRVPDEGLAIEGYSETGVRACYGGKEVARW